MIPLHFSQIGLITSLHSKVFKSSCKFALKVIFLFFQRKAKARVYKYLLHIPTKIIISMVKTPKADELSTTKTRCSHVKEETED